MKHRRILAIYLSLALVIGCLGIVPANASQEDNTIDQIPQQNSVAEESPELDTIASVISKENNHVERLYAEEGDNLNTLIFLNENGTKTMYIYDSPVKYRDDQGFVQDISLAIADSDNPSYPFRTQANSVVTEFPAVLSDGIVLSDNDVTLRLVAPPAEGNVALNHKARRLNTQTIAYTYDVKTTIEYGLTYTGFKEDIVVNEYTGQTEYPFILYTNGLELTTIDDSYYLIDDAGDIKAAIGDIIVFTADERNNTYGTLQATTIKPGEIYALTIVLDAGYLSDPNTAYPIRIDPTIELVYTEDTPNAIEEKTLQSNNTTSGSNTATVIGKNAKGISRTIMKFPGMNFASLRSAKVISATVTLRDLMCESEEMIITCYPFTGDSWTESDTQWAGLTQSWGEALDANIVSYANGRQQTVAHRYSFDITTLAQKWVNLTADESLGIIFRSPDAVENGTEYFYKTFATSERANYKPSFTITYLDHGRILAPLNNVDEGDTLQLIANMNGTVNWTSSNSTLASIDENGKVTAKKAGQVTITATCADYTPASVVLWVTIADGVYYIKNQSGFCVGTTSTPVAGVDLSTFSKATSGFAQSKLFWIISWEGNDFYTIENSLTSDLWLNVSLGDVSLSTSTQLWKIYYDGTGYVMLNEGLSDRAMSWEQPGAYPGLRVQIGTLNSNSSFRWQLEKANHVSIEFSYDYGLVDRYFSSYANEELTCDALNRWIFNTFQTVANAYAIQCGIFIECVQYEPLLYISDADLCPYSGIDTPCQCVQRCLLEFSDDPRENNNISGFTKPVHCKSLIRLRNNLIVGIPDNTIRFTFTGYDICLYSGGGPCVDTTAGALSDYNYPIIASQNPPYSIITMAHEIAHLYGIVHHERISEDQKCIMDLGNQNEFNVSDAKWWCDNCLAQLKNNRNKF